MHTRAAVSTNSLPLGVSVEVDAIFEEDSEDMNDSIKNQIKEFSILDNIFEGDE